MMCFSSVPDGSLITDLSSCCATLTRSANVGSQPPYFLIAELSFPSQEAMGASLSSPEAQAANADVPNFATGGVTIFIAYD